ncbi:bacillithiol biosynthesis cysteine-adding enzyme BshC [Lysinibacillus sp. SGAir0095]|uniref:bacillithiol biosynthesis cysteine-adding enzyme BshC n=1 Tax=Lysinibacillus sp. SGAir0095 TaxID=2070463 RepID=UPI0010CCF0E9|nr:bacillithiol biosynthesis cysteine-adding enzyme BshC [Lysinibacillus sp. SGAir0095]QCR31703.1 bacillithiol biosynthesis cysteine-adding enzyme BshC [Lysinibacillus sp. SGAir0095]
MRLEHIELPVNNKLLADYWSGNEKLRSFFKYEYNDDAFQTRYNYLKSKHYYNNELSSIIRQFMEPFGISEKAEENLNALEHGSVAVVGGQQAGILTGPLYSIHKAVSVILLAKEQSIKLGEKIVPIFWVAGEDHDLDEINHTYTNVNGAIKKRVYSDRSILKTMASTTSLQKEELEKLIRTIFKDYGETEYSQILYKNCINQLEQSETFTEFFARLMNELFKTEGLLLLDAAYTPFRKLESDFFVKMIELNEQIAKAVVKKEQTLDRAGYGTPILAKIDNANLFYVQEGERFLLERKSNLYQDATGFITLTLDQLLDIAKNNPEKLSNNVVTRPLMQEMTIPVLAFVGGPGELAYWATLKDAFNVLDLQMPIIAPRMHITLVERKIEQLLSKYELSILDIMNGKAKYLKEQYIDSVQDAEAKLQLEGLNQMVKEQYKKLEAHLNIQQLELQPIIEKNMKYHELQFDYLSKKIEQRVLIKHEKTIRQFDMMQLALYPNDSLQERVYNPFQYMNYYGPTLIRDLCALPLEIANKHYVIHL